MRDGQAAFRRGDVADAFYVVRSGTIHIEDEDPDEGDTRIITHARSRRRLRGVRPGRLRRPRRRPPVREGEATCSVSTRRRSIGCSPTTIDAPDFAPTHAGLRRAAGPAAASRTCRPPTSPSCSSTDRGATSRPGEALITQGEAGDTFYVLGTGPGRRRSRRRGDRDARAGPALRRDRAVDRRPPERQRHGAHAGARVRAGPRGVRSA